MRRSRFVPSDGDDDKDEDEEDQAVAVFHNPLVKKPHSGFGFSRPTLSCLISHSLIVLVVRYVLSLLS